MLLKSKKFVFSFERIIFFALLFLLPSQLAYHFWPDFSLVFGIRVDYLAPSIYLTDVLILASIVIWLVFRGSEAIKKIASQKYLILLFILVAAINIFFSTGPILSLVKWSHLFLLLMYSLYLSSSRYLFGERSITKTFYFSLVFFSIIGIVQFFLQRTIGGPLYLLGERSFTAGTPGIALFSFMGRQFLRAYSTFSHPNSFAGYIGAAGIFLLLGGYFKKLPFKNFGFAIIFLAFVLSSSLSAFISALVILFLWFVSKRKNISFKFIFVIVLLIVASSISLVFLSGSAGLYKLFPSDKYSQRLDLSFVSGKMISEKYLTGEGLNTFIVNLPRFKSVSGYLWFLQPVHNIYLLIFAETGILGLIAFFVFILDGLYSLCRSQNRQVVFSILFILITGIFDHYAFTLQQNLLIMFFFFSYFI